MAEQKSGHLVARGLSSVCKIEQVFEKEVGMAIFLIDSQSAGVSDTWVYDAGIVHCGFPQPSAQEFRERITLDDILISDHEATFFMRAKGTSMVDAGIDDDDVVLVDRAMTPHPGDDVVAVVDGDYTLKRLTVRHGTMVLAAMSSHDPDIAIHEWTDVIIYGVVTYVIKRKSRRVRTR
jgi:DNA polymerase V